MPARSKVKHLVVDTSAFIKNLPLQEFAENIYTTQSVVDEITSKRQLRNLVVLPYDLKIKDVFPENVKSVTEFSKKTGDYPSLSAVDIQVMALSYQLEKEHVGTDHLNLQPRVLKVANFSEETPAAYRNIAGFYLPPPKGSARASNLEEYEDSFVCAAEEDRNDKEEDDEICVRGRDGKDDDMDKQRHRTQYEIDKPSHVKEIEDIKAIIDAPSVERVKYEEFDEFPRPSKPVQGTSLDEDDIKEVEDDIYRILYERSQEKKKKRGKKKDRSKPKPKDPNGGKSCSPENLKETVDIEEEEEVLGIVGNYYCSNDGDSGDDDDDDDIWNESGWITLDNLKEAQLEVGGAELNNSPAVVACITGDFAMQNVLRQLGLQVSALDGRIIKTLRTYILRCYSCFKTTSKMELMFCPHCGNKTLRRARVVLLPDGSEEICVSSRRLPTGRGKKFSLPTPQGGKHANNPLLCPDQRLPQQHVSKLARMKNNPLDPDYIAGFSPFVMRDVNSKSAMLGIQKAGDIKNWMRRNPNEVRKKGKKGKKGDK